MDLASSVLSDNPVHEVEKFKPSPPLVLTPRHLAREADHRSRLGREIGIVAFAPALAPGEIDLVGAQEAPDILHIDVAEGFGDQRPIPARVARGNGPVEYGQEALVGRVRIFGLIASIAGFVEAGPPTLGVAYPPFRRRARRAADLSADCARRQARRRKQHNPRPLSQPVFRLRRTGQAFKLSVLFLRQCDWRRRRDAFHAPMNHDSRISESGY